MSSWGEDLKKYELERRSAVFPLLPERRLNKQPRTRDMFNIITVSYEPSELETVKAAEELKLAIDTINRGKDDMIDREGTSNIINHRSTYLGGTTMPMPYQRPKKRFFPKNKLQAPYNIVDNRDLTPQKLDALTAETNAAARESREYDIITNQYHSNHDAKFKMDKEFLARECSLKYEALLKADEGKSHICGSHREPRDMEVPNVPQAQHVSNLPACVNDSEGRLFNIVNLEVLNKDRLKERDEANAGRKAGRKLKHEFELKHARRIETDPVKERHRIINRVSHQRYNDICSRGYRLITNIPFAGVHGVPPAPPQTRPKLALEKVLQPFSPQGTLSMLGPIRTSGFS